jgi:hypothetical protein
MVKDQQGGALPEDALLGVTSCLAHRWVGDGGEVGKGKECKKKLTDELRQAIFRDQSLA